MMRNTVTGGLVKIWKTAKIGTGLKTTSDFLKTLKSNGYMYSENLENCMSNPVFINSVADQEVELDLVVMSPGQLGCKDSRPSLREIFDQRMSWGLDLCPAELAPQICIQHAGQIEHDYLLVAMEPIPSNEPPNYGFTDFVVPSETMFNAIRHNKFIFGLGRDSEDTIFLDAHYGYPFIRCSINDLFVFVNPRFDKISK